MAKIKVVAAYDPRLSLSEWGMSMVLIGIGWLVGMWATFTFDFPGDVLIIAAASTAIAFALWRDIAHVRMLLILALAAIFGALRGASAQPIFDADDVATYNDRGTVTIIGTVADYPDRRDQSVNLRVETESLAREDSTSFAANGMVLVRAPRLPEYRYGDRIEVIGQLQSPPEFSSFSYRDYLAGKGIYSIIDQPRIDLLAHDRGSPILAALFALKDHAHETIAQILPEPQSSLLAGILLGDESGISTQVKDDFRVTGTSHIIAISGYNFSVLIALASVPAVRLFGRRRAFPILLLSVFAYAVLVGASAAVLRAAIMGALTLWATYLGRQTAALNSLFTAAFVMTFLDPFTLGDAGFQLSFAATLGLVLYTRPLQGAAERGLSRLFGTERAQQIVSVLSDAVIVTMAAQITTLPLLIVNFRQFSFLTLLVNALVLPAQTGVMILGGLALLAGLIWLPLGQIVGWGAWLFLTYTIQLIHLFALVPGIAIDLGYVDPLWGVAYVTVLAALTHWFTRDKEQRMNIKARLSNISPRAVLPVIGVFALLAALAISWQPDGKLHVHVLNIDGMPVFVQTPLGRQILIGGSNSPSALLATLGNRMPFWDRDIDLVVVPKADQRSLNGLLAVIDRYSIGAILSVEIGDNRASREWLDVISAKSIAIVDVGSGVGFEDGVSLMLDEAGVVRIGSSGATVVLGTAGDASPADVWIVETMPDLPTAQIIVANQVSDAAVVPEGVSLIDLEERPIELTFDGASWMVSQPP